MNSDLWPRFDSCCRSFVVMACLATTLSGCGNPGTPSPIAGKVLYGGRPVPTGSVTFVQVSSSGDLGSRLSFPVENGRYRSHEGEGIVKGRSYRVEVDGFETAAPAPDAEQMRLFPIWQQTLIVPDGQDTLDVLVPADDKKLQLND